MKMYFEDLEEGTVFQGDECIADKEEMLDYPGKMIPRLSTLMRRLPDTPHMVASSPVGGIRSRYGIGRPFPILLQSRFLVVSNGISRCPYLCVQATDCIPRLKFLARSRRASRVGGYVTTLQKILNQDSQAVFTCEVVWMIATRPLPD
jgi:hypothetical protein